MELTPTSFALLGLLVIRPWTTYELAHQTKATVSLKLFSAGDAVDLDAKDGDKPAVRGQPDHLGDAELQHPVPPLRRPSALRCRQ